MLPKLFPQFLKYFHTCRKSHCLGEYEIVYCCSIVSVDKSTESIQLIDDGFGKICNMMNDISMRVRAEAAGLLVCVKLIYLLYLLIDLLSYFLTYWLT